MKINGRVWTDYGDGLSTLVDQRFRALVWSFGSSWQCKVIVNYPCGRKGDPGICLEMQQDMRSAMRHAVAWIKRYQWRDPDGPEAVYRAAMRNYPSIFPDRLRVVDHVWFVIGNGYAWLDGSVVNTSPDARRRAGRERLRTESPKELLRRAGVDVASRPDPEATRYHFCPVSQDYSLVSTVPDDVRNDWLSAAWEAAQLLRDKSEGEDTDANRLAGQQICERLPGRFGRRIAG